MSKLPVLKIGYMAFVLSPKAKMAAIMEALQNAQRVDYTYEQGAGMVYFPDYDHTEVAVEYIDQRQIRATDPRKKANPAAAPLTLTGGNLLPLSDHASRR